MAVWKAHAVTENLQGSMDVTDPPPHLPTEQTQDYIREGAKYTFSRNDFMSPR
jgi:hypothetical protein